MKGFRSVQVSPVGDRNLSTTWITSTFTLDDDVRAVWPTGGISVTFHAPKSAPAGWRAFCKLLGAGTDGKVTCSFQTGSWYRLKFSVTMVVDDGLEWLDTRDDRTS